MRKLILALALCVGAVIGAQPASAAPEAPSHGNQTEHNLCTLFRPYGNGAVVNHARITGDHRVCFTRYSNGVCLRYDIYHFPSLGWVGPENIRQTYVC